MTEKKKIMSKHSAKSPMQLFWSQDKYTKDCLSVDDEYDVERII